MYIAIDARRILRTLTSAILAMTISVGIAAAADVDAARGRNDVPAQQRASDQSHPRPGSSVRHLPRGYRRYHYRGHPYYFHGGVWYAPSRHGFMVVRTPIGLYMPVQPLSDGYQIVTPAGGTPGVAAPVPPVTPSDNVFIYPRNGQSEAQQSTDRYECYAWSRGQTGFDPVQGASGVSTDQSAPKRDQFNRALNACLEARGYSVK